MDNPNAPMTLHVESDTSQRSQAETSVYPDGKESVVKSPRF